MARVRHLSFSSRSANVGILGASGADVRGERMGRFVLAVCHLLAQRDGLDVPPADNR
jgi:hypothetical protein